MEEKLFAALELFSGKTQRRSLGIAILKGNWSNDKLKNLRPTWSSILTSQAVYLLTESEQHQKSHELQNLVYIMELLLTKEAKLNPKDQTSLLAVINDSKKDEKINGLKYIPPKSYKEWLEKLKDKNLNRVQH